MSTTRHTPGPWRVSKCRDGGYLAGMATTMDKPDNGLMSDCEVYDTEREAASAADDIARLYAESECEHREKWYTVQRYDGLLEEIGITRREFSHQIGFIHCQRLHNAERTDWANMWDHARRAKARTLAYIRKAREIDREHNISKLRTEVE